MSYRGGREAAFARASSALEELEELGGADALNGRAVDDSTPDAVLIETAEWAEREVRTRAFVRVSRRDAHNSFVGEALDRFMTLDRRVRTKHAQFARAIAAAGMPAAVLKLTRPKMSADPTRQREIANAIVAECERIESLARRLGIALVETEPEPIVPVAEVAELKKTEPVEDFRLLTRAEFVSRARVRKLWFVVSGIVTLAFVVAAVLVHPAVLIGILHAQLLIARGLSLIVGLPDAAKTRFGIGMMRPGPVPTDTPQRVFSGYADAHDKRFLNTSIALHASGLVIADAFFIPWESVAAVHTDALWRFLMPDVPVTVIRHASNELDERIYLPFDPNVHRALVDAAKAHAHARALPQSQ